MPQKYRFVGPSAGTAKIPSYTLFDQSREGYSKLTLLLTPT